MRHRLWASPFALCNEKMMVWEIDDEGDEPHGE
jgi:hypothetical protein